MSNILTTNKCLVLNKSYAPVGIVTLRRALLMCFAERAHIVDYPSYELFTWDDWSKLRPSATDEKISAGNIYFRIPEIIKACNYDRVPVPHAHFSRRALLKRDSFHCQYCGKKVGNDEWSVDHVLPLSQGGKTEWTNCVIACTKCNFKKGSKTPKQAGMKLLTTPKQPPASVIRGEVLKPIKSWTAFLSEAYWSVPLAD